MRKELRQTETQLRWVRGGKQRRRAKRGHAPV